MPSVFADEFGESAAPELMDEFGVSAEYIPPSGDAISGGKVRVQNERTAEPRTDEKTSKTTVLREAELRCLQTFVAVPVINGRFVLDGKDRWTVTSRPVLRNGQWEMQGQCIQERRLNEPMAARN